MTPTQQQFHEILNDSALQCVMRDLDVITGRPHTDAARAEVLTRLAKSAPHLLEEEIAVLQGKIDLLKSFLLQEVKT